MLAFRQAVARFEPTGTTFPFGAHFCEVEIDPDTGEVALTRYLAVDDAGNSYVGDSGTTAVQKFDPDGTLLWTQPARFDDVGLEVMDNGAACRTYNLLLSEFREVAVALMLGAGS